MNLGRGAKALLLLAALVLVCGGIRQGAPVLVPLLLALFVATVTAPLVLWLNDRGVPQSIAAMLAVGVDAFVFTLVTTTLGRSLSILYFKKDSYAQGLSEAVISFEHMLNNAGWPMPQAMIGQLSEPTYWLGMLGGVLKSFSNTLLIAVIIVFMLFEVAAIRKKMSYALSDEQAMARIGSAADDINRYLGAKTLLSLLTALCVYVWCVICGIDVPFLWAMLGFLLNYVPTLGSMLASVPPVFFAFVQFGLRQALAAALGFFVIHVVIGTFIEPRFMGKAFGLSPLVVFLSMFIWGSLLGPVGALLSVPLTMVIKIFLSNTEDMRWIAILLSDGRTVERESLVFNTLHEEEHTHV